MTKRLEQRKIKSIFILTFKTNQYLHFMGNDFLERITKIIEANISNEQFGVSELADEAGMSRSNLLRRVKQLTKVLKVPTH